MVAAAITKKEANVIVYERCRDKEASIVSENIFNYLSQDTQVQTINSKSITDEVKDQKDLAIHQISRLFGNIHFL